MSVFMHGSTAAFRVGNAAAVLTDISEFLTQASHPREGATSTVTTLQRTSQAYIAALVDGTIRIEGVWHPTLDGVLSGIFRLTRAYEYFPQGNVAGRVRYSGNCIMTSYEIETSVDGAGTFSAEFQVTGDVTRAIV